MSKYERQTYRMIMGVIALIGCITCVAALAKETECAPMGWVFGAGLAMIIMAYIGWPNSESHEQLEHRQ